MSIFDAILWLLAISFAFVGMIKKDQSLSMYYMIAIYCYGILLLLYGTVIENHKYSFVLEPLPLNLYAVGLFSNYMFLVSFLKFNKIKTYDMTIYLQLSFITGAGYISGSLFFGYGKSQYIVGAMLIVLSALFYINETRSSFRLFSVTSLLFLNALLIGYMGILWVDYESNITYLSEIILRYGVPLLIAIIFFCKYLGKYMVISEKQGGILVKSYLALILAGALFFHPEIGDVAKLDSLNKNIKDLLAFSEAGVLFYAGVTSAISYKYLS